MDSSIDKYKLGAAKISPSQPEVVVGTLVGFDDEGNPRVDWPGNPTGSPVSALSTALFSSVDIGREAALLFSAGDPQCPIIIGLIRQALDAIIDHTLQTSSGLTSVAEDIASAATGKKDTLNLSVEKKIVIQCGKASITLTKEGKILIRGEYILSRSSKSNQIKGASVKIN